MCLVALFLVVAFAHGESGAAEGLFWGGLTTGSDVETLSEERAGAFRATTLVVWCHGLSRVASGAFLCWRFSRRGSRGSRTWRGFRSVLLGGRVLGGWWGSWSRWGINHRFLRGRRFGEEGGGGSDCNSRASGLGLSSCFFSLIQFGECFEGDDSEFAAHLRSGNCDGEREPDDVFPEEGHEFVDADWHWRGGGLRVSGLEFADQEGLDHCEQLLMFFEFGRDPR